MDVLSYPCNSYSCVMKWANKAIRTDINILFFYPSAMAIQYFSVDYRVNTMPTSWSIVEHSYFKRVFDILFVGLQSTVNIACFSIQSLGIGLCRNIIWYYTGFFQLLFNLIKRYTKDLLQILHSPPLLHIITKVRNYSSSAANM